MGRSAHQDVAPVPGLKTPTCRRWIRGFRAQPRRPNNSCSSATRSSTGSTKTACSCPISIAGCSISARRKSSRPRPVPVKPTCSPPALDFSDYAFFKDAEKRYPVKVNLWKRIQGPDLIFCQTSTAPTRSGAICSGTTRCRALSLAIDRHEINMVSFYGLASESADTILPDSALFKPEYAAAWASHDPDQANRLLDEVGLDATQQRRHPAAAWTGGKRRSSSRPPARVRLRPTCWNSSRTIGRKSDSRFCIETSQRDVFSSRTIERRDHDVDVVGHRKRCPHSRYEPRRSCTRAGTTSISGPHGACTICPSDRTASAPELPEAIKLIDLAQATGANTRQQRRQNAYLARNAGHLYAERLFDRHRQRSAPADHALRLYPQHSRKRPLRLRPNLLSPGSICQTRSGTAKRLADHAALHFLAYPGDDPDAGDHLARWFSRSSSCRLAITSSYIAELRAQGEAVDTAEIDACARRTASINRC